MSSTTYNTSAFADAQDSREFVGDLDVNDPHLYNTFDNEHLSPFPSSHTASNSVSPSNHLTSTPGDSYSEYSTYQQSNFSELGEDQFLGVDFGAGVIRTDSLPSNIYGNTIYTHSDLNRALPNLPYEVEKPASDTLTASTYPLSPVHTSIPNTPSPAAINDLKTNATITAQELNTNLHKPQYQSFEVGTPNTNTANLQLTPDHSGSSHTSAEGLEPTTMTGLDHSPHVMVSQWSQGYTEPLRAPYSREGRFATTSDGEIPQSQAASVLRGEDGSWRSNERTGQSGLDPNSRRAIENETVETLDEQEERRRIAHKNIEVFEWRSQAGGSSEAEEERAGQSYFPPPPPNREWYQQSTPRQHPDPAENIDNIGPVDDAASIRENKTVAGQVYYDTESRNGPLSQVDIELMRQPRHWNDAPAVPYIMTTTFQPQTSNDAMERFRRHADTISIASRAATWGTRRRSEPSLADWESVQSGSFLKKLSISKPTATRQHSLFDQGLDKLANIVRKRSESKPNSSSKLKRSLSAHHVQDESQITPASRQNSQGTLAPPPRTPSFGKRQTPSINTAMAVMVAPLAAVGTTHARNGSVSASHGAISATATSPKSPNHLGWPSRVIHRARSRSDLSQTTPNPGQSGLAGLWRGHGGPPVPTLASPPVEVPSEIDTRHQAELQDQDEDEDEEDEQADEIDLKSEGEQDPIVPNYEGFKAHVRRLNPNMDPKHNWLVSRIAHQQEIRYKNLLDLRVKHSQATGNRNCGAGRLCIALGGNATLLDAKGQPKEPDHSSTGLQLVTDFSDEDSNPGEGALSEETFPPGVPMPPTKNLPAEFECQLCFKAKKFQKPSDWTKHVHEDVQPFTCTYDKCKEPKSFKRKADWVRHENERHRHLEWWICQVDDCRHPCYRKDNFLQHLVREHKLPEPKQKTKAAIKKARMTEPAWKMLELCHHETQHRPQDEACKFCGKSFTTWKKLTVHLAKHMEHISLPVLRLVEVRNVDANTIISPVEQNLTPITPISRAKMESQSPFNMNSISPHIPMNNQQFGTSTFDNFFSTGPNGGFGVPQQMAPEAYNQNQLYASNNAFGIQNMDQRAFGTLDAGGLNQVNQTRGFRTSDAGFTQNQHQRTLSRPYGSLDANFSHQIPERNFVPTPTSAFPLAQEYTSATISPSTYPTSNVMGLHEGAFMYDGLPVSTTQGFQQQTPTTRAPANNQPYGHLGQNASYYG
ncbi:C2H2 and C2HC zinc finger [Glarea lozoyensis ATCC 20868]|uniref:C2H2 and C2HC zinc finger n=1 Tax=Glarea lozoyensis (strain ATCC 20868 / MF5171) TaxID=1116229 RepID=S3CW70_GLAL2|nr:C2H2 and C2HC zinc finger [Glarea lozoyensis ATCC 20868]EPE29179.1 C2H2 and C2HC zinc finger [Glarea lozoyensis ATCC 20868]